MLFKENILIPQWKKEFNNLICGFTTPFFGNMALTRRSVSTKRTLKENRVFLSETLNIPSNTIFSPRQTHSDTVLYVNDNNVGRGAYSLDGAQDGDACITDKKNILLLVSWADCIPVLLFEEEKGICAAIHSGWRGAKENIAAKTIKKIIEIGGKESNIYAAVGPGIRDCCYKVGIDVIKYFENDNYSEFIRKNDGEYYLDLQSVVCRQIILSGVKKENIDNYGECNSCSTKIEFFSCRKDGKEKFEGQAAFIGIY
ncbi:MAG TPA: peptidoglycan editing factor PgeF [Spirochaetota bacterium]|nr:MAG: Laccase domain protein [Spirochaetes bacterium ADurb.Bin133]HNZ26244.1 peptidoglycan editing factor PgeF [Spirochaetota bacterium]HPY87416.1 peptidoglycan editing factor PgeF [Spirochaetota bacterium]HQB61466.1 peptidoglycan editing factor PgeF [Spirochaetota bacterium]